jgi:hypothetical protein
MTVFDDDDAVSRHPGYVSQRYYAGYPAVTGTTSALPSIDTLSFSLMVLTRPVTIDRLKVNVVTGVASAILKIGLWRADETTRKPIGAPLVVDDTGLNCSVSSSSPEFTIDPAITLSPGFYWFGCKSGHTPTLQNLATSGAAFSWSHGRSTGASVVNLTAFTLATQPVGDPMPTLTGSEATDGTSAGVPLLWFRVA